MAERIVCADSDVKNGHGKKVVVEGEEIVLFRTADGVCAVSNICPHQKFQRLHEGMFQDGIVTCPMHGWAYDVRTGISTNASGRIRTYLVDVKDGNIVIAIE